MLVLFSDFHEAQRAGDGNLLASCLAPINSSADPQRLYNFSQLSNYQNISADLRYHITSGGDASKLVKGEVNQWVEILTLFWKCVRELAQIEADRPGNWNVAFKAYKDMCIQLCRGYSHHGFQAWTVPCLYTVGKYLRLLAMKADTHHAQATTNGNGFAHALSDDSADEVGKNERLQDAARTLQQMVSVCRTDDSDLAESRKWGIIGLANLLFKTYFKLNNLALAKNVINLLESEGLDLPPLTAFPKAHHCTYSYYRGVLDFLREDYGGAERYLSDAFSLCPRTSTRNREQILTYLIPAHMLNDHKLPGAKLLAELPGLGALLTPLCQAIKSGNLAAFDRALLDAEDELISKRIYLTLERSRDLCVRNLFRKVYLNGGYEDSKEADGSIVRIRRTRLDISAFENAFRVASRNAPEPVVMDKDEVECYLSNMIYKGYMKGYIAREQGKVVLSKKGDPFPLS